MPACVGQINTHHVMVISKIIKVTSSFLQMNNPYHVPLCSTIPLPFLLFNFPCSMVLSCAHLNYSHILLLLSGSLSSFPRFPVLQLDKEFLLFQHVSAASYSQAAVESSTVMVITKRWYFLQKSQLMLVKSTIYSHLSWFYRWVLSINSFWSKRYPSCFRIMKSQPQ